MTDATARPTAADPVTPPGLPLVGCVLTKNEARTIQRVVHSLSMVCDHVLVVDSCSTDPTVDLATAAGADVVTRPFTDYADQRNWALDQIEDRYGPCWVLSIDADEWLGDDLIDQLRRQRSRLDDADIYLIRRRVRFDGRILRFGGFGGTWLARLFRSDLTRYEPRVVNEHLAIPPTARVGRIEGWLEHDDVDSWSAYVDKHNRYSTLEAEARLALERSGSPPVTFGEARRDPTLRRRFLRERLWNRLPAKPAVRFLQVYVVLGGFLDGRSGFHRAVFEAWQEMVTDLKARELRTKAPQSR